MKTIPLNTLVGQITPLPWKMHETGSIVPSDYNSDGAYLYCRETSRLDMNYIIHCCNHFPELVEAVKEYTKEREYQNVEACKKDQDRLEKKLLAVLASAETVQIEE